MTKFILLFLMVACSTKSTHVTLAYLVNAKIKLIDVSSPEQGNSVIDNHLRFLKLLFEQSRDPYYGKYKWTKECLAENVIGRREEFDGHMVATSVLFLDENGKPGHCSGTKYTVSLVYCSEGKFVIEMKYPVTEKVYDSKGVCK
jgi:hypothetical protein